MRLQTLAATLTIFLGGNFLQSASANQLAIQNAYKEWKASQLRAGKYLESSQCNMQSFLNLVKAGRRVASHGFGTAAFSYGDINRDGTEDALVVFNPQQCDGGNASMNMQTAILILSANNGSHYIVDDKKLEHIKGAPTDMWTKFERVKSDGRIAGTAYGYRRTDPRCCPSRQAAFTYAYPNNKLIMD